MTDLATLQASDAGVTLRRAVLDDLPIIVQLLIDDPLGHAREGGDHADAMEPYVRAFEHEGFKLDLPR